jgi:RNA polymerase sigma-70 factor (ECF subfamily)
MQSEVVEKARAGDVEAFQALVRDVAPRLYGIACRILRDTSRAEDALQQSLIQIWEGLPRLRDPDRFDAWAYRLVVHASYREAKRQRRWNTSVRQILVEPSAVDHVGRVLDRDEVERSFRHLSPEHRAVLVLHHVIGLRIREIAEVLGIPLGTAESRLHYATREFRAAFEADARSAVAWRASA